MINVWVSNYCLISCLVWVAKIRCLYHIILDPVAFSLWSYFLDPAILYTCSLLDFIHFGLVIEVSVMLLLGLSFPVSNSILCSWFSMQKENLNLFLASTLNHNDSMHNPMYPSGGPLTYKIRSVHSLYMHPF